MGRRPMHESVKFFWSTSLVDALSRFAYDGVSHVRCIFWEPESVIEEHVITAPVWFDPFVQNLFIIAPGGVPIV